MIRRAFLPLPRLLLPGLRAGAVALVVLAGPGVAAGAEELALQAEAGRGALRPYVHVFAAYGVAWALILVWVWRIARGLKRVEKGIEGVGSLPDPK